MSRLNVKEMLMVRNTSVLKGKWPRAGFRKSGREADCDVCCSHVALWTYSDLIVPGNVLNNYLNATQGWVIAQFKGKSKAALIMEMSSRRHIHFIFQHWKQTWDWSWMQIYHHYQCHSDRFFECLESTGNRLAAFGWFQTSSFSLWFLDFSLWK